MKAGTAVAIKNGVSGPPRLNESYRYQKHDKTVLNVDWSRLMLPDHTEMNE